MIRYAIVFQPRSGSTQLLSRLNAPLFGFEAGYELISLDTVKQLSLIDSQEIDSWGPSLKKEIVHRYFCRFSNARVVGFKFALYQVNDDLPGFVQFISSYVDKLIFLYRDDIFETALSQCLSLVSLHDGKISATHAQSDSLVENDKIVSIDPDIFEYYLIDSFYNKSTIISLSEKFSPSLAISYENAPLAPSSSMVEIYDFLGLKDQLPHLNGDFVKPRSARLSRRISNMLDLEKRAARAFECGRRITTVSETLLHAVNGDTVDSSSPDPRPQRELGPLEQIRLMTERAFIAEAHCKSLATELERLRKKYEP